VHGACSLLRILGQAPFTDHETAITTPSGERHEVEISSVPLKKHHQVVGRVRRHPAATASWPAYGSAEPSRVRPS
jgi:hypothetical protein